MRISRLWPLAGLPLALAACGGGEADVRDEASVLETADSSQVEFPPAVTAPADTGTAAGGAMGETPP